MHLFHVALFDMLTMNRQTFNTIADALSSLVSGLAGSTVGIPHIIYLNALCVQALPSCTRLTPALNRSYH